MEQDSLILTEPGQERSRRPWWPLLAVSLVLVAVVRLSPQPEVPSDEWELEEGPVEPVSKLRMGVEMAHARLNGVRGEWVPFYRGLVDRDVDTLVNTQRNDSVIRVYRNFGRDLVVYRGKEEIRGFYEESFQMMWPLLHKSDRSLCVLESHDLSDGHSAVFAVWKTEVQSPDFASLVLIFDGHGKVVRQNMVEGYARHVRRLGEDADEKTTSTTTTTTSTATTTAAATTTTTTSTTTVEAPPANATMEETWSGFKARWLAKDAKGVVSYMHENAHVDFYNVRRNRRHAYNHNHATLLYYTQLFNHLTDTEEFKLRVSEVDEWKDGGGMVFSVWSCPSSNISLATSTYLFGVDKKIERQYSVVEHRASAASASAVVALLVGLRWMG